MDTLMPEGFFGNTREIYAEVASYPVVPPEKIKQYWNAYTTTFRRLFDPSAFRLENFWWHVWGSEKLRNLSGPALAKLFEEFSNGPTFVPLSLPADRLARSKPPDPGRRRIAGDPPPEAAQSSHDSPEQGAGSPASRKGPPPSSSRPQPTHSILKKSRGPSASGPRPTARFASPLALYEEAISVDDDASASTAVIASGMPPPPLPPSARKKQAVAPLVASPAVNTFPAPVVEHKPSSPISTVSEGELRPAPSVSSARGGKTAANSGRKIVAATAASKRKPVMTRRLSSQSSGGSDTGTRMANHVTTSKRSSRRSLPTTSQISGQSSSSPQTSDTGISAKAAGKRPAKAVSSKRPSFRSFPAGANGDGDESGQTGQTRLPSPQRRSTWDTRGSIETREPFQGPQAASRRPILAHSSPPVAGFAVDQPSRHRGPPMVRSRSNNTERDPGVALLPSQATSSVATFITTARGQFDSETVTAEPVVPEARDIPDQVRFGSQPSPSNLDLQFRPTPPNPTPPIPFGRSRSELTLLLKRGRTDKEDGI